MQKSRRTSGKRDFFRGKRAEEDARGAENLRIKANELVNRKKTASTGAKTVAALLSIQLFDI